MAITLIVESDQSVQGSVIDSIAERRTVAGWKEKTPDTGTSALKFEISEGRHQAPYADLVFQALQSLKREAPDLPCDADDDL